MIKMLPIITKRLKLKESKSGQQINLENDFDVIRKILINLKDNNSKVKVKELLISIAGQLDTLEDDPNHYE